MCQGVIVSLVKFPHKGKTRRVVLSGIGSHSTLISENANLLKRRGCLMDGQESVVSIEADFSGWNKFTVESGEPDKIDMRLLRQEYKKCAGGGRALVSFAKKVGRIDDSLVNLLAAPARAEYDKVVAAAWAEYDKVRTTTLSYHKVAAAAWAEYDKVRAATWARLFARKSNRAKHLQ